VLIMRGSKGIGKATAIAFAEKERLLLESPFKRMAEPFEVAHAILFLASK